MHKRTGKVNCSDQAGQSSLGPNFAFRRSLSVLLFLFAGADCAFNQNVLQQPLKDLTAVVVDLVWGGGNEQDRSALQTDVELKLRQAGIRVVTKPELVDVTRAMGVRPPILSIQISAGTQIALTEVELIEGVYIQRQIVLQAKAQSAGKDVQDSYIGTAATTWIRYGFAPTSPPETVPQIIARYANHPYWQTPAGRPIVQHMMDLEVQAAMEEAKRTPNPTTVRDAIKDYVDAFINDWLAANPKKP